MYNVGFGSFPENMEGFPGALEAEDIEDFCALAQYYSSRTPQSFRRVSSRHSFTAV